jgi:hypothetical protein
MKASDQDIQSILQQISDVLLMNGGFLSNPGLYTGEMGLVLFLFRYSRFTQNKLYADYCFELIETFEKRIHQDTPIDYKEGLAGIGSAIEYLVQNGFIETNTDDILEDFDNQIFSIDNLPCLSIKEIKSVVYYAIWRISGNSSKKDAIRQTILPKIMICKEERWEKLSVPDLLHLIRKENPDSYSIKTNDRLLEQIMENDPLLTKNIDLGIQNGLAGLGMTLITELDGNDSWCSLFPDDLIPPLPFTEINNLVISPIL